MRAALRLWMTTMLVCDETKEGVVASYNPKQIVESISRLRASVG